MCHLWGNITLWLRVCHSVIYCIARPIKFSFFLFIYFIIIADMYFFFQNQLLGSFFHSFPLSFFRFRFHNFFSGFQISCFSAAGQTMSSNPPLSDICFKIVALTYSYDQTDEFLFIGKRWNLTKSQNYCWVRNSLTLRSHVHTIPENAKFSSKPYNQHCFIVCQDLEVNFCLCTYPVPNQTLFLTYFWYIFKTVLIVFENFI